MSLAQPARRLCGSIGFAALAWGAANAHAAAEIADFLARDWYATEIIVFQRVAVMEMNSVERLIALNASPLPSDMRTFFPAPGQIGAGYDLDPFTRATLEFPILQDVRDVVAVEAAAPTPELPKGPPTIHPVLEPNPMLEFRDLVRRFEDLLEEQSYRWLPETQFLMARDARLIERRGDNRVLLHGRWLQPVPGRDQPEPMFIQAGSKLAGRYQLEGTMAVTLGRFLHFQAQLSYREPGMGQRPVNLPVSVNGLPETIALPARVPGYMVLNQSRRMRSKEIHYIDHPKLGIVVRIDPVAFPNDLVADLEALKETLE